MGHPPLQRVRKGRPCPMCGHDSFCSFNDYVIICTRIESNRPDKSGFGWIHIPEGSVRRQYEQDFYAPPTSSRSSMENISFVYEEMHKRMKLSSRHLVDLQNRGMAGYEMLRYGYKTMPSQRRTFAREIGEAVSEFGHTISGVPGFYQKEGQWTLGGNSGIAIPAKSIDGKIVGYQIRLDEPIGKQKYLWLSSANKPSGCGSGTPVHVAKPREVNSPFVYITEGIIKANIAAERLHAYVIGVPGVSIWKPLFEILPAFEAEMFVIAYDADFRINKDVAKAHDRLVARMKEKNYRVGDLNWPLEFGKGIDDLLVNGHRPVLQIL